MVNVLNLVSAPKPRAMLYRFFLLIVEFSSNPEVISIKRKINKIVQ